MHLFSNASDNYFPGNRPWEFTSMLPEPLLLQGRWLCGLTEIEYSRTASSVQLPLHLAVYSDICKASITGNQQTALLRCIPVSERKGKRIFYNPNTVNYHLLNKHDINRIHVSIKCPGSTPETLFDQKPCRVTLHFCKAPPLVL